jgi:DNA modification methylase
MSSQALDLKIGYVAVDGLRPHPRNARTHSKRQIRQIADSIRTFGFTNPVLIDAHNTIIAGHGRVEAAKLLGLDAVPTVRLEHLTDDQIRAYVIADNRLAEKAGWDKAILSIELQHLTTVDAGFDVTVTGFDVPEIDLLIGTAAADAAESQISTEDLDRSPVSRLGDVWILGRHCIVCGDARDSQAYLNVLRDERARIVFTDPPYNVPIDGNVSGLGAVRHREFAMAAGEMSEAEFIAFLEQVCRRLVEHSEPGSLHYLCMDWRHVFELLTAGRGLYSELKNLCVWVKNNAGMGSLYRSQHEFVAVFKHGTAPHRNNVQLGRYGRNRANVWNYPSPNHFGRGEDDGTGPMHPTIKPITLIADALLDASARGDLVLDPFLGSGSTLIAAERVGRRCAGLEIDPGYVDAVIRRWQRHSGDDAIHADSGRHFNDIEAQREDSQHDK